MGVTGCFSFVSAQAHSRTSQSLSSSLVDYLPPVPAQVANCAVTGTVWSDLNNNGSRQSGEGGAAGRTAFVDIDDDGALDANEPSDATDAQGFYFIPTTLTAGSYKVRVVVPPNSLCTSPASCSHTSTFTATGTNTVQNDFGIYFFTPPQNTWAPSISGSPQEGSTLTADRGLWNGTDPISYAYQWLRCDAAGNNCVNIAGATNQTYTTTPADLSKTIRVRVTGTNMMGSASRRQPADRIRHPAPPGKHRASDYLRHPAGGLDPDGLPGHLDRHRPDQLRLPLAALRRGRRQLRRHRRRHRPDLQPRRRRHRQDDPRPRHGDERLGNACHRGQLPDRPGHRPGSGQHDRAGDCGKRPGSLDPHRLPGHLDRHPADQLHLPVAALRCRRRQLRRHRRRDEPVLRPRPR